MAEVVGSWRRLSRSLARRFRTALDGLATHRYGSPPSTTPRGPPLEPTTVSTVGPINHTKRNRPIGRRFPLHFAGDLMKRRFRVFLGAALLLGSMGVGGQAASAATVPNQLVCSTSTNRCYQTNGGFNASVPCKHIYNVSWAITSEWPTYSQWRARCTKGWS